MQYQVTRQYAKDKELPLAEFTNRQVAVNFIRLESDRDEQEMRIRIYRLYENGKLSQEYNVERLEVACSRAQYARGDSDLPEPFVEPFRVIQVTPDDAKTLIAKFLTIDEARNFVESMFKADPVTYFIFNGQQFIEKINSTSVDQQATEKAQKQRAEPKSSFRPTPFMTQLRMGPPNWVQEEKDDKEDEK